MAEVIGKPILGWLKEDLTPTSELAFTSAADGSFAPVVAQQTSQPLTFYVANNFTKGTAATEAVQDATNCVIRVTALDGSMISPVVKEKWITAKCGDDGTQVSLGGVDQSSEQKLDVTAGDASRPNTISGGANDGDSAVGGKYNVAKVIATLTPPLNTEATGGLTEFRLVLVYSYGAGA